MLLAGSPPVGARASALPPNPAPRPPRPHPVRPALLSLLLLLHLSLPHCLPSRPNIHARVTIICSLRFPDNHSFFFLLRFLSMAILFFFLTSPSSLGTPPRLLRNQRPEREVLSGRGVALAYIRRIRKDRRKNAADEGDRDVLRRAARAWITRAQPPDLRVT